LDNLSGFLELLGSTIHSMYDLWPFQDYAVFKGTLHKSDFTLSFSSVLSCSLKTLPPVY